MILILLLFFLNSVFSEFKSMKKKKKKKKKENLRDEEERVKMEAKRLTLTRNIITVKIDIYENFKIKAIFCFVFFGGKKIMKASFQL